MFSGLYPGIHLLEPKVYIRDDVYRDVHAFASTYCWIRRTEVNKGVVQRSSSYATNVSSSAEQMSLNSVEADAGTATIMKPES